MRQRPHTLLASRFRLRTPLGNGGMGELWLAEHLGLGTEVVVKFISAELSDRPGAAERFAREAAAAAQVNSPHVVKILDYGASPDGAPFIVMEKLEGRDLASYLGARGSLPPDSVARIVQQLAKALTKAHAARIVHRDIKPANVFVCETEAELFVKLLDFGVAKTEAPDRGAPTMSGACVGTPGYMSPEQIVASKELDFRADLWSLGVLAFHCLTGRKPFDGETAGAVLLAIHTLPLPKPSRYVTSLPPALDTWFERACAREPEQRFASATELANALSSTLAVPLDPLAPDAEEPPLESPPPTLSALPPAEAEGGSLSQLTTTHEPRVRPRRSRPALLVTAMAAVALGVVAFEGRTSHAPPNPPPVSIARGDIASPAPLAPSTAPLVLADAPRVLETPHPAPDPAPPPARDPRPRARHPVTPAPASSSAVAATSAPSPPPIASDGGAAPGAGAPPAEANTSRLYVMPDARR